MDFKDLNLFVIVQREYVFRYPQTVLQRHFVDIRRLDHSRALLADTRYTLTSTLYNLHLGGSRMAQHPNVLWNIVGCT